ncbi:tRNA (adenosine(37)-N6)-threonylcarbamoyltransferase complex ATPase subunit type 1 TsaE [Ruicaihuangia caeni]|uniref:tRNA (adenosine(37)-N6)-threonylcarbamoyltransferase complex ATPase subunit type 1 TsaE n=1 Tax=Ruicaihuangia caeni TaxID=3042517 RepID=UPI003BF5677C
MTGEAVITRFTVETPERMQQLGAALARRLRAGDLVALNGELGAGKTTLTRGLGAALGVRGTVTSPTFVLARTHPRGDGGPPLVHVDAYRLSSAVELDDLDIDFESSIVVVEWGAGMLDGISDSWLELDIVRPMGGADAGDSRRGEAVEASLELDSNARWGDAAAGEAADEHDEDDEDALVGDPDAHERPAERPADRSGPEMPPGLVNRPMSDEGELDAPRPRVVTVTGHGPRWRDLGFLAEFGGRSRA